MVRHLGTLLLQDASTSRGSQIAASTDDEFWGLLLTNARTADAARALRRDPLGWQVVDPDADAARTPGAISFAVTRLYLDVPLVDGAPLDRDHAAFGDRPVLPWRRAILPPSST